MNTDNTINHYESGAQIMKALEGVEAAIAATGFDEKLHHLILLRASQINGCGFCVKMHSRDARKAGETNHRLDHLIIWRHSDDFSEKEKLAFEWTEALTRLDKEEDLPRLRKELRAHYSDQEISTMTAMIGMINLWNRVAISNH
ncbi:alkyl hydroperoxide reductase AhpD [Pseudovibrio japonicus]|uniref:Alkyl hydroperoxide reductase AhpD n=1 Tax=Pseudovibrio japonicus TaxID=366534 RepID=A0ABQ3EJY2_9HYPH|nr:carboxymuconolactone decarboxylase family protein [Pseudovibrio japonicus]GHB43504.1 alkyl hydroperoxide reductase AhpD [Pseudovibrio japonicus]